MIDPVFREVLTLLGLSVVAIVAFHRLRVPTSLGYLLVGAVVGPNALGWVADADHNRVLAEFGIVFLLFTIGLSFAGPQIRAMRGMVFSLGVAQVGLTTLVVGGLAWVLGLPPLAALVAGAVFAQSSTIIIARQLAEQGEDQTRHGRLATAMSVFQDVTAVPLVVVIPVLGAAAGAGAMVLPLGVAFAKALLAFALVLLLARWVLRPLLREVAAWRSPELFTLAVLLVTLVAAGITDLLDLSMALGAFLAGLVLGETEFRHQIEATIRPFRDVLLGLFFITIGMMVEPAALPDIWHWAVLVAAGVFVCKALLIVAIVRLGGVALPDAVRIGVVLAIGGEFGFALLALALLDGLIAPDVAQIILTAVLIGMISAPLWIRGNRWFGRRFAQPVVARDPEVTTELPAGLRDHVIVCGYGRVGQNVARFLAEEAVPYVALDMDPARVRDAHAAGMPVYFADSSDPDVLRSVTVERAILVVVSHDDLAATRRLLANLSSLAPAARVMVRARDDAPVEELLALGAAEVVPETFEASIMIGAHVLLLGGVAPSRVLKRMRSAQRDRYRLLREVFVGTDIVDAEPGKPRLHSIRLGADWNAVGRRLGDVEFGHCVLQALVRDEHRDETPLPETVLRPDDVLVLYGEPKALDVCESVLYASRSS